MNQTISTGVDICTVPIGWGSWYTQQWFVGTNSLGGDIVSRISFGDYKFSNINAKGDVPNLFCSGCYIAK